VLATILRLLVTLEVLLKEMSQRCLQFLPVTYAHCEVEIWVFTLMDLFL